MLIRLVVLLCMTLFAGSASAGYFVSNGKDITYTSEDPKKAKPPKEWHILLFKKGQSPLGGAWGGGYFGKVPNNNWGLITDKTLEGANKQLKKSQEFEKRFERWMRKSNPSYEDPNTYFNYVGPIAVYEEPKPLSVAVVSKVKEVWEKIEEIKQIHDSVKQILAKSPADKNPFENVGNVTGEYVDNFKDVFEKQKQLREIMSDVSMTADATLAQLSNFSKDLDIVKTDAKKMQTAFQSKPAGNANPKLAAAMEKMIADYNSWGYKLLAEQSGVMIWSPGKTDDRGYYDISVIPDLRVVKPGSEVKVAFRGDYSCAGRASDYFLGENDITVGEEPILNSKTTAYPMQCSYPTLTVSMTSVQVEPPKKQQKKGVDYSKGLKVGYDRN